MPVLLEPGVELLLVLGFLVCYGLVLAHRYSLSPVLQTIARLFDAVSIPIPFHHIHPLRFAASAVRDLDSSIQHWLALGVDATESGVVYVGHLFASTFAWLGRSIAELAESTYAALVHLETVYLPRLITKATKELTSLVERAVAAAKADVLALERDVRADLSKAAAEAATLGHGLASGLADLDARLARGIDSVIRQLQSDLSAGIDSLRGWTEGQLSALGRELDAVEASIAGLGGRVSGLENLLTGSAFVALVATALSTLGLDFLKCKNVGKAGKFLCGLDQALLDDLLGLSFALLAVLDPEALAEAALALEAGMETIIRDTVA